MEKGKGLVLGRLHTIQLIEADFQLIMRIFLILRNQGAIEIDKELSKYNFGLRKSYVIEEVLLEIRLLCNPAMNTQD